MQQFGLSVAEQERVWVLRGSGLSLRALASVLGQPPHRVKRYVAACGGKRPVLRRRGARCLSVTEREEVSRGLADGQSARWIAAAIGRSSSTVSFTDEREAINGSVGEPRRLVKVGSLRFRPNGSMAWIACTENDPQVFSASRQPNCVRPGKGRKWVMRKRVGSDKAEVLDTGSRIEPSSLRLSGSRLVWKEAGRRKSRQLP